MKIALRTLAIYIGMLVVSLVWIAVRDGLEKIPHIIDGIKWIINSGNYSLLSGFILAAFALPLLFSYFLACFSINVLDKKR